MSDKLEKLAALHEEEPEPYIAASRVVRTMEGAKRFRVPVGTVIQGRPKELKKLERTTKIDPKTGKVKYPRAAKLDYKLFAMRVEELKEAIKKLDREAIKNLLAQLEAAKDLPKSTNYQKIRELLKKYLKEKSDKGEEVKEKATGK